VGDSSVVGVAVRGMVVMAVVVHSVLVMMIGHWRLLRRASEASVTERWYLTRAQRSLSTHAKRDKQRATDSCGPA